jgi:SAM-dependent methyltransferase
MRAGARPQGRYRIACISMGIRSSVYGLYRRLLKPEAPARPPDPVAAPTAAPAPVVDPTLIRPEDIVARYSIAELCETAEEYYRRVPDPLPLMAKPFAFLHETPEMLENLGRLLSGLRLGTTMTVLDFGAGTCWLSRALTQMQCRTIAVDTSASALAIGRRLFAEYPPIGAALLEPQFLHFDGRRLALPDASVDRIACFDAFHHVPNQAEVLAEFGRVLRPGGIAGFSEPGRHHSRQPQSQYEMRNHRVLENDIDLNRIFELASAAGFTAISVKLLTDTEVSLDDYNGVFASPPPEALRGRVWSDTHDTTFNRSIFFLHKGTQALDSRGREGLAHAITIDDNEYTVTGGAPARIPITLRNTGTARWIHAHGGIHGTVRLGAHLLDAAGALVDIDHFRTFLPASVEPGAELRMTVEVPVPADRTSVLVFDLVAEGVTWFENAGSRPVSVTVRSS